MDEKIDQLAERVKPKIDVKTKLFDVTKGQQLRIDQNKAAKERGEKGEINVGFDLFAVIPIGGLQKASWM